MDKEPEYYSLLLNYARLLAPLYDALFVCLTFGAGSRLRDDVADFADPVRGAKILDVATGTGKQAFAFAKRGYDVTGIDLSEEMLKVALKQNVYENAIFEIADATRLPFRNNSFDVSCISFALHDMILSIREKALRELVRVTKAEGIIIVVDYGVPENGFIRFLAYKIIRLYEPYYKEFIKSDLEGLLRKTGIQIENELSVLHGVGRILKGKNT